MIPAFIYSICAWGVCFAAYRIMLVYAEMRLRLANAATAPEKRVSVPPLPPVVRMWILWIVAAMGIMNAVTAGVIIGWARKPSSVMAADSRCTPENCKYPKKCNGNTCTAQAQTDISVPSKPTSSIETEYAGGASSLVAAPDGIN